MEDKPSMVVTGVGLAHFFCWANYPWLRRGWGDRFSGLPAVISVFFVMPLTIAEIDRNGRVAQWALLATLGMCLVRRIQNLIWKPKEHPHYSGRSLFKGDEWRAKGVKEPLLVLALSILALPVSRGLAVYLGISALCLSATVSYGKASIAAKARLMEASRIEQLTIMNHYKEMFGNEE